MIFRFKGARYLQKPDAQKKAARDQIAGMQESARQMSEEKEDSKQLLG